MYSSLLFDFKIQQLKKKTQFFAFRGLVDFIIETGQ